MSADCVIPSSVTVPLGAWESLLSFWEEALQERFDEVKECWGRPGHTALWPLLFERLKKDAREGVMSEMDVYGLVDNFLVNGEIVEREEFKEGGQRESCWERYGGEWNSCCEDAIVHDDNYALLRF